MKKKYWIILFVLIAVFSTFNCFTYRVGFGFPGKEIDFIGMTKKEVLENLFLKNKNVAIVIDLYRHRTYSDIKKALVHDLLMESNKWGVNEKENGMVNYNQVLFFNKNNKVYRQNIDITYDGP